METDLDVARRAALAGAEVGLRYFAALARLPRERKVDGSIVTEADRAVEAAVRDVITRARPGDAVLGEEGGLTGTGERRWIVDPIDGTALFVDGDDRWLVLVALQERGETVVGVAAVPAQDAIWWAGRGAGAHRGALRGAAGRPVAARREAPGDRDALTGSRLGVVPADVAPAEREMLGALTAVATVVPWRTHAALLVACGELDLAVQTRGQVWDFAATALIVEEAGGRYSGLDGRRRPGPGPSLFASSPALHRAALHRLTAAPGPTR